MADLAWAAGVLDVAGQWAAIPRVTKSGTSYTMRVRVRRPSGEREVLDHLCEMFGGSVGAYGSLGRLEWHVSGAKASLALYEEICPYLVQRARRAQAHAELCRRIVGFHPAGLDRTVPQGELVERHQLAQAARLHGVMVPTRPRARPPASPVALPF